MKVARFHLLFVALLVAFVLAGCETAHRLARLELGMTTEQVTKAMGRPHAISGGAKDAEGREMRVWEYLLIRPLGAPEYSALYFVDGQLERWGPAADIRADIKAEVNVNAGK